MLDTGQGHSGSICYPNLATGQTSHIATSQESHLVPSQDAIVHHCHPLGTH